MKHMAEVYAEMASKIRWAIHTSTQESPINWPYPVSQQLGAYCATAITEVLKVNLEKPDLDPVGFYKQCYWEEKGEGVTVLTSPS